MFLRIVLMDVQQLQAVINSIPPSSAAVTASSAPDAPRSVRMAAQDSRVEVRNRVLYLTCFTFMLLFNFVQREKQLQK